MTTPPKVRAAKGWRPTTVPGRPPKECIDCAATASAPRIWRATDHAKLKPRCATHQRDQHLAAKLRSRSVYQERNFGMTQDDHDALLIEQNYVCAVCLYANGRTKALATDHDHNCCSGPTSCGGCVRGKLCGLDNLDMIGRIEMIAKRNNERPADVCLRIMSYFEDPPMGRVRRRLMKESA